MIKRILIALLLLPWAAHAAPADRYPDEQFSNYLPLTTLLKSEGIDPVSVPWQPIDMQCLPIRGQGGGEVAFNRCKYNFVKTWREHGLDANVCKRRAERDLTRITYQPPVITEHVRAVTGQPPRISTTYAYTELPTRREKNRLRDVSYETCMDDFGWYDPYAWLSGKR